MSHYTLTPLRHPTVMCSDTAYGSEELHQYRRKNWSGSCQLSDWSAHVWLGTIHEMTENQRLSYNVRQLGAVSAAAFEAARK